MKVRLAIGIIIILAIVGYFTWRYQQDRMKESWIKASGTIETTEVQVGSRVGGRIKAVVAREGDWVNRGDVLVQLDPYQLPAQRRELEAQLARAQAILEELERGARPEEIAAAEAQYQRAQAQANLVSAGAREEEIAQAEANRRQAEADLENTRRTHQRFQELLERHVISQQESDTARTAFEVAEEQVNAARQREMELRRGNRPQEVIAAKEQARAQREQLRLLRAGTRSEDIAAQQAVIQGIQAQLQQLEETAAELAILSPCRCQVSSMELQAGQLVMPNQTVAALINLEDLWVRVYIPEERFGLVQPGDKTIVTVDAFPGSPFSGTVVQMASRAEFTPRNVQTEESRRLQVFGIKVALDNRERFLRPGMPADVTFTLNHPKVKSGFIHGQ